MLQPQIPRTASGEDLGEFPHLADLIFRGKSRRLLSKVLLLLPSRRRLYLLVSATSEMVSLF
jgi:hypothetical protein